MATIIASNIPVTIKDEKLKEFFSFCGTIKSIKLIDEGAKTKRYEIQFELEKALSTATLLNEAELDGVPIKVEESDSPPQYTKELGLTRGTANIAGTAGTTAGSTKEVDAGKVGEVGDVGNVGDAGDVGDHKIQSTVETGDSAYDDISQEEKPKYAIMAQLLASGYNLSDSFIEKSIKFDKEKGYSEKFKDFLSSLDKKYVRLNEPESTANKSISKAQSTLSGLTQSFNNSSYSQKLSSYYEKAANHPYGVKVHDFYKNLASDVRDVHKEARRLAELKKEKNGSSGSTVDDAGADAPASAGTGAAATAAATSTEKQ